MERYQLKIHERYLRLTSSFSSSHLAPVYSSPHLITNNIDPQANLKMGVIITNVGEFSRVCYYQPPYPELSEKYWWTSVIGSFPKKMSHFTENYHLAMSTIIFPDLQTMKIKKKSSGQYSPRLVMITLFLVITRRTNNYYILSRARKVGVIPGSRDSMTS